MKSGRAHRCWHTCSPSSRQLLLAPRSGGDAVPALRRGDQGRFHIVTLGQMSCDATTFFVKDEVRVTEGEGVGEREVFAKTWRHEAPRDFG